MELLLDCLVSAFFITVYLSDARKAAPAPIASPAPIVTEEPIAIVAEESILAGVSQYIACTIAEFTPTLAVSVEPDAWETEPGRHPLVESEWELESDIPTGDTTTTPIELLTAAPIADTTIEPTDAQPVTPLERMTLKQLIPIAKRYKLRTANVRKPALLAAIKAAMAE